MKNNICYIFGAGDYFEPVPTPCPGDYIIAADGGYDYLELHNFTANLIVGDFDSCKKPPSSADTITLPKEKDDTDMAAALNIGFEKGFRIFYIYGGVGGRIEHTLANIQCLADLADKGARGFLFDKDNVITAIKNSSAYFQANATGYVSVFAHSDVASGVYEKGLKYPLDNATLNNNAPLGVSNEFTGIASSISVSAGTLIIIYSKNIHEIFL